MAASSYSTAVAQTKAFQQCLCWSIKAGDWCFKSEEGNGDIFCAAGSDEHNVPGLCLPMSHPCKHMFEGVYQVGIPFAFIAFLLVTFPLTFLIGRMICNCCGGKTPNRAVCCPSNKQLADGKTYSEKSRKVFKILVPLLFSVYTVIFVPLFLQTYALKTSVLKLSDHVNEDITPSIQGAYQSLASSLRVLSDIDQITVPYGLVNTCERNDEFWANNVPAVLRDRTRSVKDFEDSPGENRSFFTNVVVGFPLVMFTIVMITMLCGRGGALLHLIGCILAPFFACVAFMAGVYVLAYWGTDLACNSFDQTTSPLMNGIVQNMKGPQSCGGAGFFPVSNMVVQLNMPLGDYINVMCDDSDFRNSAYNQYRRACEDAYDDTTTDHYRVLTANLQECYNDGTCISFINKHSLLKRTIDNMMNFGYADVNTCFDPAMLSFKQNVYATVCTGDGVNQGMRHNLKMLGVLMVVETILGCICLVAVMMGAKRFASDQPGAVPSSAQLAAFAPMLGQGYYGQFEARQREAQIADEVSHLFASLHDDHDDSLERDDGYDSLPQSSRGGGRLQIEEEGCSELEDDSCSSSSSTPSSSFSSHPQYAAEEGDHADHTAVRINARPLKKPHRAVRYSDDEDE